MLDEMELLMDLHVKGQRQGPGGEKETLKAIELAQIDKNTPLRIADIGCGTGASTQVLFEYLNADIAAVDLFPEFLDVLNSKIPKSGGSSKVTTYACSMDALPFEKEEFDIIWSEGAIYNMGFEKGVESLRSYLKPGGKLIVSEATWLSGNRPKEIQEYWDTQYPTMGTAGSNFKVLEKTGYFPEAYFVLPKHCWVDAYYEPLKERFDSFLLRNAGNDTAKAIVENDQKEISLYERYGDYYGYGFYIASKVSP